MRTAMLTRYPENKEVRGIMKLVNRVEDKKNGYKLTYEAELVEGRTEQQTLQEWLRRENEWQKNRAKASSKFHDASYLFVLRVPGKHCGAHLCDLLLFDIVQECIYKISILRQHIT